MCGLMFRSCVNPVVKIVFTPILLLLFEGHRASFARSGTNIRRDTYDDDTVKTSNEFGVAIGIGAAAH